MLQSVGSLQEEANACLRRLGYLEDSDMINDEEDHRELFAKSSECLAACEEVTEMLGDGSTSEGALDPEVEEMVRAEVEGIEETMRLVSLSVLMSRKRADCGAFVTLNAGAGGHDSADWCAMLMRMYELWGDRKCMETEALDVSEGEHGIKSATLKVTGGPAFGWLELETGVHRLVRISPFDSKARRHTSFAVVQVIAADSEESGMKELPASELRIDTMRASGAGGQHVNTTDSAVRITHLPTGMVAQASSRSQHHNRTSAMAMLKAKLRQKDEDMRRAAAKQQRQETAGKSWGDQTRNYVLHPTQTVLDLRSRYSCPAGRVLDGDMDDLLLAGLEHHMDGSTEAGSPPASR